MAYRGRVAYSTADTTLVRHSPQRAEVMIVNYFITREAQHFVPITTDVHRGGVFLAAFRCENESIQFVDRGSGIGEIKCPSSFHVLFDNHLVLVLHDAYRESNYRVCVCDRLMK